MKRSVMPLSEVLAGCYERRNPTIDNGKRRPSKDSDRTINALPLAAPARQRRDRN